MLAYCFDEASGATTSDQSGNGRTGTLVGGPARIAGKYGNGLLFNGGRGGHQYVSIAPDDTFDGLTNGTIMAWVALAAGSSGIHGVFQAGENGQCNRPMQLYSNGPTFALWGGGSACDATVSASTAIPSPVNGWHHYAYVVDGTGSRVYIDGALRSLSYKTGNASTRLFFSHIATGVSRYRVGATELAAETFDGTIDEFRVYAVPLTPTQIQAAMSSSFCPGG